MLGQTDLLRLLADTLDENGWQPCAMYSFPASFSSQQTLRLPIPAFQKNNDWPRRAGYHPDSQPTNRPFLR